MFLRYEKSQLFARYPKAIRKCLGMLHQLLLRHRNGFSSIVLAAKVLQYQMIGMILMRKSGKDDLSEWLFLLYSKCV